jgi:hypothetical protein
VDGEAWAGTLGHISIGRDGLEARWLHAFHSSVLFDSLKLLRCLGSISDAIIFYTFHFFSERFTTAFTYLFLCDVKHNAIRPSPYIGPFLPL